MNDPVEVVDFPGVRVAALEYRGRPDALDDAVPRFIAWRRENERLPDVSATFNIAHTGLEDPDFRFDLCAVVAGPVPPNPHGVVEKQIPAGRCARLRHVGPERALEPAIRYLFLEWLPNSGEARRADPLFYQRVRFGPGVAPSDAITDIYLPLQARA